jgi:hypothetical protein
MEPLRLRHFQMGAVTRIACHSEGERQSALR